jgi:hypothetical protein
MDFFGGLALVLLTLVGFSSGAVVAGRGEKEPLGLLDLGVAILFLALALGTRSFFGKWLAIPIWFFISGSGSALLTKIRFKEHRTAKETTLVPKGKGTLQRIWDGWKVFTAKLGNYQGRLMFAFFYFVVVTPFGIGVRLFSDPLKVKQAGRATNWLERSSVKHGLESGREQF